MFSSVKTLLKSKHDRASSVPKFKMRTYLFHDTSNSKHLVLLHDSRKKTQLIGSQFRQVLLARNL